MSPREGDLVEWTLSGFGDEIADDPAVQLAVLQAVGARFVEFRAAWGVNVVELGAGRLREVRRMLDEQGMGVSAIASPVGKVDVARGVADEVERLNRAFEAAEILGTRYVRVFSFYRGEGLGAPAVRDAVLANVTTLVRHAEGAGFVLLHENERGIYGDTPARVLDLMESVSSPALRVTWDPANFVQVGVRPFTEGYAALKDYVEYLQIKDAVLGSGEIRPAGEGDGEIAETVAALREDGYRGFVSLEPHLTVAGSMSGFSGPLAFGRAARALDRLLASAGVRTI